MNLSAPTVVVFLISLIIAIVGIAAKYGGVSLPIDSFVIMLVAYIVLAAGSLLKGL